MREIKFKGWLKELQTFVPMSHTLMSHWFEFPEDVIMCQYTGLKDKNGKEIYEGDILQNEDFSDKRMVVVWDDMLHYDNWFPKDKWDIVGNIYENPELLDKPTQARSGTGDGEKN